jgi:hypothetical protein
MEYITFFLSSLLFFTNPQEQVLINPNTVPNIEVSIINNCYATNCNFKVKNIIFTDNNYSVSILDSNNAEITFSGMQEIYVSVSDKQYLPGQKIGKDFSLNYSTKYILIPYRSNTSFPQIVNNKLFFDIKSGIPVYAIYSGEIEKVYYESNRGNTISQKIIDPSQNTSDEIFAEIEYWHLKSVFVSKGDEVVSTQVIAHSGNTGLTSAPNLTIFFHSSDYFFDYKIIYLKE